MKALLTSGGVTNDSIRAAPVALLGKPIAEANAVDDATAIQGVDAAVEVISGGNWRLLRP